MHRPGGLAQAHALDEEAEQALSVGGEVERRRRGFQGDCVVAAEASEVALDPLDQYRVGSGIDPDGNTSKGRKDGPEKARFDKPDRADRPDRAERPARPARTEQGDRPEGAEGTGKGGKPLRSMKDHQEVGMTRMHVNVGKSQRMAPGRLVQLVCSMANVAGDQVGMIEIHQFFTFFDVREGIADQVMDSLTGRMFEGKKIKATLV